MVRSFLPIHKSAELNPFSSGVALGEECFIWIVDFCWEVYSRLYHMFGFSVVLGVFWTVCNVCESPDFWKFGEFR